MLTLTATFLSIIVDNEWDSSRLVASVKLHTGVTVPAVFQSDEWSTIAAMVLVDIGGSVLLLGLKTARSYARVSLAVYLSCFEKWGKWMRPSVLSMTTLLGHKKCNPIMGPLKFFITTKCSGKLCSQISNLGVAVAIGFSNWPFAT